MAEPRRTRLIVDIEWRGHPDGREPYYDEDERVSVARDWIEGAFEDRDDSPRVHIAAVNGASTDRGMDSGEALTSVRTVLSRAETALKELGPDGTKREYPPKTPDRGRDNHAVRRAAMFEDPDAHAMRDALRAVVALLSPWRKTGRTKRSTSL